MKKFTAVLRRAGLQVDQSLVTTESLHQIVAETSVPFSITPTVFGGPEIGRVTRIWVEDDILWGEVELDDIAHGQSLAEALAEECPHGADGRVYETGCPCICHLRIGGEDFDRTLRGLPPLPSLPTPCCTHSKEDVSYNAAIDPQPSPSS